MPLREYHTIRAVHRGVKALTHRSWAVAAAAAAPDRPAPPSPVASDTGIPAGPDRSKAGGHIRQHIPQRRRRPTPSRWPARSPADAGSDHVLKLQEPFLPPRGQWPSGPVSMPLRRSLDEGFRQNRAKRPCPAVVLFFPDPTETDPGLCRMQPPGAHPVSPERQPCARPPVLHTVPVLHWP